MKKEVVQMVHVASSINAYALVCTHIPCFVSAGQQVCKECQLSWARALPGTATKMLSQAPLFSDPRDLRGSSSQDER